jgi:PAS domain S-box-containing protein
MDASCSIQPGMSLSSVGRLGYDGSVCRPTRPGHGGLAMNKRRIYGAALIYAAVSLSYITFSDSIVYRLWPDPVQAQLASTLKGWVFVVLTATLMAALLLRLATRETSRYRALLDNHHAVILVVDTKTSRILDASAAAEQYYGWSRNQLLGRHLSTINVLPPDQIEAEMQRARRNEVPVFHFRHRLASGEIRDVDVYAGPIELDGRSCLLSLITDVTEQRLAERTLLQQNRLYNILSRTTQLVRSTTDPLHFYDALCSIAVVQGGFVFGWIGVTDGKGTFVPVANAAQDADSLERMRAYLVLHHDIGTLLAGMAMQQQRLVVSNDYLHDELTAPNHDNARRFGIRSAAAFPFRIGGKFIGVLSLYSADTDNFGKLEQDTLQEIAREISFGLDNMGRITALETTVDVVEKSPVVLFRWLNAAGWPVAFVSDNVARWGYTASLFRSGLLPFEELVHPDDRSRIAMEVADHIGEKAGNFQKEYRIVTADGRIRWVDDNTAAIRDADGNLLYLQGTLTDITEQHQAIMSLQASEERFRRAIEEAPFPIMIHAENGEVLALSKAWSRLSGYTLQDIPSIAEWTRRAYGDQHVVVRNYIEDLYDLVESRAEGEYEIRCGNGQLLTWEFSSVGLGRLPDGRRTAISMAFDQTSRKAMENAVQESEAQYRRILDNAPDLIFVNRGDTVFYINPAGARMLGATTDGGLLGRSIYQFFDPRFHAGIRQRIADLRAAPGTLVPITYEAMRTLDGSTLHMNVMAVSYQAGEQIDILVTCRDVSELRQNEATIASYVKKLEGAVLGTANAVSQMIELRDPYTAGHQHRVGELAAAIAAEMGLEELLQRGLRIAGALHDSGKIVVPAEILTKPGRLTEAEFNLIKQHAEQGYQVLRNVDFPWPVAEVARQHHERLDGSGYPAGLKGDEILLEARIIAVADVVESMSSHRPYRAALGPARALKEIEDGAGIRYDAVVAAACLSLFRDKGYTFSD